MPDGLFDAEVLTGWRRWSLREDIGADVVEPARVRLNSIRFRRISVRALSQQAWTLRHNVSFTDGCYVALAERLDAPLVTADMKLVDAPGLPVQTIHP